MICLPNFWFRSVALPLALALPLSGCALSDGAQDQNATGTKNSVAGEHREKYRQNPNPAQAYEIILSVANAPGTFESVEGHAYYEAPNCSFVVDRAAGVRSHPDIGLPVLLHKRQDGSYTGTVYFDAMVDDEYFGNGTCRWKMTSMSVRLMATGAKAETRYAPSLTNRQVADACPVRYYFWKGTYPSSRTSGFAAFGETDPAKYRTEIRDDLFSITLAARNPKNQQISCR
ncbi:hypothetical protein RAS12_06030 [Achromobacter seleniivolatilans]|uniref:Lipoprotein n=1 Tax=Achromobacter seleniivolatilans TaxID=3047478 RepID=A0ABY9M4L6_9BURK|nr:hypothetical protein [Achromobacter sp. R39]WMD21931.1 hypothetical protein RAS12_06030 [Achromobacter sp. R39]